jgi:hypothetical protein
MRAWGNQVGIQSEKVNFHKVEKQLGELPTQEFRGVR